MLSNMLRKEINAVFQKEVVRNRHRKRQSFEKLSNSIFCQNIDKLRGLQCLNAEGVGKLVVSVSFRYEISSIRKRKGPQIDLRCQNFEVFVVFDAISVDFPKDFVLSSAIHSTTKKRAMQCFLEENITVFCFTNTSE